MKALLIYPEFPDTLWSLKHALKFIRKQASSPPLGLLTLPPFLLDLERDSTKRIYSSSEFPDIRDTPTPRWELVDFKRYATMPIQYSRGCPFDCEFCNITALLGHRPRVKSAEQILRELDRLYRLGWRGRKWTSSASARMI